MYRITGNSENRSRSWPEESTTGWVNNSGNTLKKQIIYTNKAHPHYGYTFPCMFVSVCVCDTTPLCFVSTRTITRLTTSPSEVGPVGPATRPTEAWQLQEDRAAALGWVERASGDLWSQGRSPQCDHSLKRNLGQLLAPGG